LEFPIKKRNPELKVRGILLINQATKTYPQFFHKSLTNILYNKEVSSRVLHHIFLAIGIFIFLIATPGAFLFVQNIAEAKSNNPKLRNNLQPQILPSDDTLFTEIELASYINSTEAELADFAESIKKFKLNLYNFFFKQPAKSIKPVSPVPSVPSFKPALKPQEPGVNFSKFVPQVPIITAKEEKPKEVIIIEKHFIEKQIAPQVAAPSIISSEEISRVEAALAIFKKQQEATNVGFQQMISSTNRITSLPPNITINAPTISGTISGLTDDSVPNDITIDTTRSIKTSGAFESTATSATSTFIGGVTTSGLFSSNGISITGGSLLNTSGATSTFTSGISAGGLSSSGGITLTGGSLLSSSTATSTLSGGVNLTAGCFSVNGSCVGAGTGSGVADNGTTVTLTTNSDLFSVGTGTPSAKLTIWSDGASTNKSFEVANNASGTLFTILDSGNIGVGSTTPGTKFAVQGAAVITGTSTVQAIIATSGIEASYITVTTSGTSSFSGGASTAGLSSSNGLSISGGSLLNTSAATSTFSAGISATYLTSSGNANVSGILTTFGLVATNSTTTNATTTNLAVTSNSSSTFVGPIVSAGLSSSNGLTITGGSLLSTSNSTSTLANGFNLTAGCFSVNGSCVGASSGWTDGGSTVYTTTASDSVGVGGSTTPWGLLSVESVAGTVGANNPIFVVGDQGTSTPLLLVSGNNGNVGIGTSTPWAKFSVAGLQNGIGLIMAVSTSSTVTTTPVFVVDASGKIGIGGTSTPSEQLTVVGNISNISATSSLPLLKSRVTTGTTPIVPYVSGRYLYLVNQDSATMQIFDVSTSTPAHVSTTSTGATPTGLFISGRYAYIVNQGPDNMQIFDISNVRNPRLVGSILTGTDPFYIYVTGKYAYVVNSTSNTLQIFDISDPYNPKGPVGIAPTGTFPAYVFVYGRYAYIATFTSNTLEIFDVSDPARPVRTSTVSTGVGAASAYVSGSYAYVVNNSDNTLQVFDISNPYSPALRGTVGTQAGPNSIFVSGRYAYVPNIALPDPGTLQIFDISNPSVIVSLGSVPTPDGATFVYVAGRYAYVTHLSSSLSVFDIGGIETTSAIVHSLEVGNLQVRNDIIAQGLLQVQTGINVGSGGIMSSGALSIVATSTAADFNSASFGNRVAIGTSTPIARLTVWGSGSDNGSLLKLVNGASTTVLTVLDNGTIGVGATNTPFALLSIAASTTGSIPLLAVSTSTASATSTAFVIDSAGRVGIGTTSPSKDFSVQGLAIVGGNGTSSFVADLSVGGLRVKSGGLTIDSNILSTGAGTSTFSAGISAIYLQSTGNLGVSGLINTTGITQTLSTSTNATTTNLAITGTGTSTVTAGLSAGYFFSSGNISGVNAYLAGLDITRSTTTNATTTNLAVIGTGTTTFTGAVSTAGLSSSNGLTITGGSILSTSLATSTLSNGINITSGCFAVSGVCVTGGGSGGGWTDDGTVVRTTTATDQVGVGSTTPWGLFSVESQKGVVGANTPIFVIGHSGTTTPFLLVSGNNGNVGIGTTTPSALLSLNAPAGQASFMVGSSTTSFVIDKNGAVGIGTTSPTVVGDRQVGLAIAGSLHVHASTSVPELRLTNLLGDMGSSTPKANTLYRENIVKGWVSFDGTGTVRIRDRFNVSSITDNGTGDFTVNWANAFSSANYAVAITLGQTAGGASGCTGFATPNADVLAGSIKMNTVDAAGALADCVFNFMIAIGDQ